MNYLFNNNNEATGLFLYFFKLTVLHCIVLYICIVVVVIIIIKINSMYSFVYSCSGGWLSVVF